MHVHFCGVRGSTPAPGADFVRYGGHTPCLALTHHEARNPTLLLDAGIGLQKVSALLTGSPFTGTILLSHLHWDHIVGLPFFGAADRADARTELLLPEQPDSDDAEEVLANMMRPPYFPIKPSELRGEWTFAMFTTGEQTVEGFTVLARELPHKGGRTYGYRVSDGRTTLAYMPDHCPTALGPGDDGYGAFHPAAMELAKDADLLVHDAQMFPEELAAGAAFGHAVADYAVGLARRSMARSVALFHHRHDRSDDELDALQLRLGGASPGGPHVSVAAEGRTLDLASV